MSGNFHNNFPPLTPQEARETTRPALDYTRRDQVKAVYVHTPYRETMYKISEALDKARIPHELHVRPGYVTIWAHVDLHEKVAEIARKIDQEWIESI